MNSPSLKTIRALTLTLFASACISACSLPRQTDGKIGVDTGGVNYSDQAMTYALSDPNDPNNHSAEPVDPYGAGGTMCCFRIPETWQAGIKVRLKIYDGSLNLVKDTMVELSPYVDGKPGQLWAALYQDGSVEVVSSNYGPPHAKWPGKIKGWPVPSIEYRRKLWERDFEYKKDDVYTGQILLKQLRDDPEKSLKKSWAFDTKYHAKETKHFSGSDDPAYKKYLIERYEESIAISQQYLDDWIKRKP